MYLTITEMRTPLHLGHFILSQRYIYSEELHYKTTQQVAKNEELNKLASVLINAGHAKGLLVVLSRGDSPRVHQATNTLTVTVCCYCSLGILLTFHSVMCTESPDTFLVINTHRLLSNSYPSVPLYSSKCS